MAHFLLCQQKVEFKNIHWALVGWMELCCLQHPPWFQRLEMMEEEEGELPTFQQFGTKVLAVMKPPPEEEQPQDRVGPVEQSG